MSGFEGFRSKKVERKEAVAAPETFPQGDALLARYAADHEADPHSIEEMRNIFADYRDRALENAKLFHTEDGTEFPYTSVSPASARDARA